MSRTLIILKSLVFFIGIVCSLLYLSSCLTPYVSPFNWHYLSFAALFFPILLVAMLGWTIVAIIWFRKYSPIFIFFLALGYQNIISVFAFNPVKEFQVNKDSGNIRILSWNVNNFNINATDKDLRAIEMIQYMQSQKPDIMCLQDFSELHSGKFGATIDSIKSFTGLPYHFYSMAEADYGVIILSRWPFLNRQAVPLTNNPLTESLQYADIQTPNKVFRVYNTHLASMNIHVETTEEAHVYKLKFLDQSKVVLMKKEKLHRMAFFDRFHIQQAQLVKRSLDSCKIPFIFTADLNSVPSSFDYHHLSKHLNDAFLEKGFGFGRTYDSLSPTLRIDVLFTSKDIATKQIKIPRIHQSDHLPIITDIYLKP
jgi:endonuclease/exonuclease/phosphatase family metal-dependent hydrolase